MSGFWPSLVGFQNSTTWQCIGERTQKSLEEDGTQNEADEDKGLNCYCASRGGGGGGGAKNKVEDTILQL